MKWWNGLGCVGCVAVLSGCALFQPQPACVCAKPAAVAKAGACAPEPAASAPAEAEAVPAGVVALPPGVRVVEQWQDTSDVAIARKISEKLRVNLVLPKGKFQKNAEVAIEAALTPKGRVLGPRIARSSGSKPLDNAVLVALRRAEPLPVPRSIRESDSTQTIKLVFRPLQPH